MFRPTKGMVAPGGRRKAYEITCQRCALVFRAAHARRMYCDECMDQIRREYRKEKHND
jgi:ribosomal protein S27AE